MRKFISTVLAIVFVFSIPIMAFADSDIWTCSKGHENPIDNQFCGKCGEAKPEEEQPWTCSKGHENTSDNAFCTTCGEKRIVSDGDQLWKELYEKMEYETALPLIQEAADQGDVEAIAALAMYEIYGYIDDPDYEKGLELARQAADAGNARGMFLIARCYTNGQGISQDHDKALEWYKKAADLGDSYAMNGMGVAYQNGKGVPQDYDKALEWFLKSADLGSDKAMINIANLYYNGNGVSQDYEKAMEWYIKSADLGNTAAMNTIGYMYYYGKGVSPNYDKALEWFKKSADKGYAKGSENYKKAQDAGCIVTPDDLIGYWSTNDGMHTFELRQEGQLNTTVPVVPQSGDSSIWDFNVYYRYFSNNPDKKTPNLKVKVISDTEIEIYSYQTKTTYTLYKRR